SEYGLMALAFMAQNKSRSTSAKDIVAELDVPRRLLAEVLKDLSRNMIVTGTRGPGGGYRLNRTPSQITLCEVVECLDGPLNVVDCSDDGECDRSPSCIIKSGVIKVSEDIRSVLTNSTLQDLADGSEDHQPHGALNAAASPLPVFPV
ncbi:MAG: Rrf2 family transcriptional regulator, partial [Planctomycetota bacterium]|nr:Rrf2 family transcriptional regulator [Planctomycetota bacterium]